MNAGLILVAGIGNVFKGDDAFGVKVAQHLAEHDPPGNLRVIDFGIRGFDLACALTDGYDAAILVDLASRGGEPGTLYVIDPEVDTLDDVEPDGHGLHPAKVLALAQAMGGAVSNVRVLGCEPEPRDDPDDDLHVGLSEAVQDAVQPAAELTLRVAAAMGDELKNREREVVR